MRIVVTEDMAMIREEIVRWCREHGHSVVAETASAAATLKLCREHRPDALLLDVRLPDGDGLSVAQAIHQAVPKVKIIVLTAYTTSCFVHRLAQAPVDGYIDKNAQTCAAIGEALAAVAAGKKWFSPSFHRVQRKQKRDPHFFGKLLTAREQEILGWIGRSFSDEEIAAQIGLAARTVEWHRSNLMHKLRHDCTAKLIAFAIEHGFAPALALPSAN